jgi:hypothetical protein
MSAQPLQSHPAYDLGHRGDLDYTQIDKMLAMTPTQRWRRYQRWRQLFRRVPAMVPPLLDEIVLRLSQAQVEYVIVGGVSAILQGVMVNTFDLDICYRRTPANIALLVAALRDLNPRPRGWPADLPFAFDERTILLGSNFTLDVGEEDLDLLGDMSAIGGYEEVAGQATQMQVAGCPVKVLSLEHLIATKEAAGRPKDLLALPTLRAALERRRSQARSDDEPPPSS